MHQLFLQGCEGPKLLRSSRTTSFFTDGQYRASPASLPPKQMSERVSITAIIAQAKAKGQQVAADLEREFKTLAERDGWTRRRSGFRVVTEATKNWRRRERPYGLIGGVTRSQYFRARQGELLLGD